MLELVGITKKAGADTCLLENVNLLFPPGSITGILSLNQEETSALAQIAAMSLRPDSGHVAINGKRLAFPDLFHARPKSIAAAFNQFAPLPNLSVLDNLYLGNSRSSTLRFVRKYKATTLASKILKKFAMQLLLEQSASTLNKEQQAVITIARAFLFDAQYYILDRITDNLSIASYSTLIDLCNQLRESKRTIIFIPSHVDQVFDLCDEVVVLRNGGIAFRGDVAMTNPQEVRNIMNNTPYAINQAIVNTFGRLEKQLDSLDELVECTLKLIDNFCACHNTFCCYLNDNGQPQASFNAPAGKYATREVLDALGHLLSPNTQQQEHPDTITVGDRSYRIHTVQLTNTSTAFIGMFKEAPALSRTLSHLVYEFAKSYKHLLAEIEKRKEIKRINNALLQKNQELTELSNELRQRISAQQRLIAIQEMTSDLVATFLPDYRITYMNTAGRTMLGWTGSDKCIGRFLSDAYPPDEFLRVIQQCIPTAIRNGTWTGETTLRTANGTLVPVSQVLIVHTADDGSVEFISTITRDIRQRLKTENELRDSRERLQITLNSIGDAVITTDLEGRITGMNRMAETLLECSTHQALGHKLKELIRIFNSQDDRDIESPIEQVLRKKRKVTLESNTSIRTQKGTERRVSDSGAPICDANGQIVGVVVVMHDVTEQYRLQEELHHTQKLDSIGQLAGGVAHDFNNMLGGIIGSAEILAPLVADDDKSTSLVNMIINTAERAADLTSKLLLFSRKGKILSTPIDLHRIIEDSVAILERTLDKRVNIVKKLLARQSTIVGDPSQIQNIIINMGVNAGHAMPEGGTLTVSTENAKLSLRECKSIPFSLQPGTYIQIKIADTGIGMSKEVQKRVFEPFFTTKEVGKGTGLGLSAAYGTIKEHSGAIEVDSTPGQGTIFTVYLPVEEVKLVQEKPMAEELIQGTGCILVIDDEDIIRATASHLLESLGYEVLLAENGKRGVEVYQQNKDQIDLVIVDMVMPTMSGRDCFREILTINPQAKVLMSSGLARTSEMTALLNEGLSGFIQKPYRRSDLGQAIIHALTE